ncbi:TetR/AcrR family transcriptional regulator [Lentzea sp. JNUCC 0626]|uniref:TetR/AcrR family transcriptional regulator n=1 Tax=Lentzea sp. JNUCC 0626 TaxID=3367513 RepID=UPI00374A8D92
MATESDQVARPRRRDAVATRKALLDAARALMAEHGVAGTSTRDVATAAGVNQTLVYRYFGSKEKLFSEAAESNVTGADLIIEQTPLDELVSALLTRVLGMSATSGADTDIAALASAANDETVRAIIRERIERGFGDRLAQRLDGPDAALRAELVAAMITGIAFLYRKIGTTALTGADRATLDGWVRSMAAPLLASPEAGNH